MTIENNVEAAEMNDSTDLNDSTNSTNIESKFIQRALQDDSNTHYKIAGYACVFDEVDSYGTVMKRGCFAESIQAQATRPAPIPLLWSHDPSNQIGSIERLYEDEYGLYMEARLTKGVQRAEEVYTLLKNGDLSGLSVGCRAIQRIKENGRIAFTKLGVYEISLTPLPSNDLSRVMIVRSMLENNEIPSISQIERAMREVFGLSRSQAKAFLNHGYKAIQNIQRDVESSEAADAINTENADALENQSEQVEVQLEVQTEVVIAADAVQQEQPEQQEPQAEEPADIDLLNTEAKRALQEINDLFRSMVK